MSLWIVSMALATEPGARVPGVSPAGVALRSELVLTWAEVGFRAAGPESPAVGADLLAVGPAGSWAVYSPVGRRIVTATSAWSVSGADALAFTDAGLLVVMDDRARSLVVYGEDGEILGRRGFPDIVPHGGALAVVGSLLVSVDVFGNGHPLASVNESGVLVPPSKNTLRAPTRRVVTSGTSVLVDGRRVASVGERGGARLLGDWLLVESVSQGDVSRVAIPLEGGETLNLPVRGRLYAPTVDASAAPDGTFGWMDPQPDGLHVVVVTP